MERWLILSLAAALFWGVNALLVKLVVDRAYMDLEASRTNLFVAFGILVTMALYDRLAPVPFSAGRLNAYALSFAIGIVWALGNIFALEAVRAGGRMSQVVPIYNTNTLVAVVLITVLLREIPAGADLIRVLIGAILITLGAILVS